jgi:hypothetical protein
VACSSFSIHTTIGTSKFEKIPLHTSISCFEKRGPKRKRGSDSLILFFPKIDNTTSKF